MPTNVGEHGRNDYPERAGLENKAVIGDYESGVHMMKFSEVFLKSD